MMDANNYTSTQHDLNIPVITTAVGMDLTLDWSGVMKDLLCHPKTPIQSVTFAEVPMNNKTIASLENELAVGTFDSTREVTKYFILDLPTGSTSTTTMLSALNSSGTKLNPATDYTVMPNVTYLLAFANTIQLNKGVESMAILQPSTSSNVTTVAAPDACSSNVLTFAASLGTPLSIPNSAPYTIDWSDLTKDGFGNPISFVGIDKVEVAYFDGKQPSDLQAHFTDIEVDATTLYSGAISGGATSYDLAGTKTMGGQSFTGFTPSSGTWAMALMCTSCAVPAPVAFTILQPK